MPRQLKVYRTAVGFRDAYVAAPSKAAALRAWGTKKDLFARGAAEQVTDPELTRDALSKPGEVVYRTRGGLEEQVAALGKLPSRHTGQTAKTAEATPARSTQPIRRRPPRPRPSRAELDAADRAIAALQEEQERAEVELKRREQALAAERKVMQERFARQHENLIKKQQRIRNAYEAALKNWDP